MEEVRDVCALILDFRQLMGDHKSLDRRSTFLLPTGPR